MPSDSAASATPRPTKVADIPAAIDAIASTNEFLYALSTQRGLVFAVPLTVQDGGSAQILSSSEHEPFAIVVQGDTPIWATADGVFTATAKSGRRSVMTRNHVRALAANSSAIYVAVDESIWRIDWPHSSVPLKIASNANADEMIVVGRSLAWRDGRQLWRMNLDDGTRAQLSPEGQRKPHGLSTDGTVAFWHEGEADLLPGREPSAFLADSANSWAVSKVRGRYESSDDHAIREGVIYGEAKCKSLTDAEWRRFPSGDSQTAVGASPVTANLKNWYWVEAICEDGGCGERSRIFAMRRSVCQSQR